MSVPVPDRSIAETTAAIGAGDVSAVALTEQYLERIAAHDRSLNVYRTVTADLALEQATAVDAAVGHGEPLGPLAGIPVALKDNIAVAGVRLTAGTHYRRDVLAAEDAPAYAALRAAGAVLLGKLNMSEWAIGGTNQNIHYGDVHNPWDPARVSGGSSGGSGAAIGADLALATVGTDTGGSIRLPASLNGCCGLRGTGGLVSNRGSIPVAWTFDAIGPLARRAEDVAAVLQVIAGHDHEDPISSGVPVGDYVGALERDISGMRIGLLSGYYLDALDDDFRIQLLAAAEQFAALGATVEEVALPDHEAAIEWTAELLLAEAAAFHHERLRDTPGMFASDVLTRLRRGESITGPNYGRGRQWQRTWQRQVLDALSGSDLLMCAGASRPAPLAAESDPLQMTGVLARFTSMWVLSRTPVMAVPCGFVDELPVAMQLVARPFDEASILRAAHAYQGVTRWHLRRPDPARWSTAGVTA